MNYWGRILGIVFGYMFAGIFGALLGFFLGNIFDNGIINLDTNLDKVKSEFFKSTFLVMGNLAKADGMVTQAEITMATKLMDEMQLSSEQRAYAIELFRAGKRGDFNLDNTLKKLMLACKWRKDLLQIFLEIQFQAAYVDGSINLEEKRILSLLCQKLGFSEADYIRLDALYRYNYDKAKQSYNTGNPYSQTVNSLNQAYKILGVDSSISYDALKKAYRKLMSQHHPDKLIAKGLPDEMLKIATEKTQEIKQAYEQIKLAKGWR